MRVIALHIRIYRRVVAVGDKGAGTGTMARSEVSRVQRYARRVLLLLGGCLMYLNHSVSVSTISPRRPNCYDGPQACWFNLVRLGPNHQSLTDATSSKAIYQGARITRDYQEAVRHIACRSIRLVQEVEYPQHTLRLRTEVGSSERSSLCVCVCAEALAPTIVFWTWQTVNTELMAKYAYLLSRAHVCTYVAHGCTCMASSAQQRYVQPCFR